MHTDLYLYEWANTLMEGSIVKVYLIKNHMDKCILLEHSNNNKKVIVEG